MPTMLEVTKQIASRIIDKGKPLRIVGSDCHASGASKKPGMLKKVFPIQSNHLQVKILA